jgi:hypothetical protein
VQERERGFDELKLRGERVSVSDHEREWLVTYAWLPP